MDSNSLIGQYRAVHGAAQQMLKFANKSAWGDVSRTAIAIGGMTDRLRKVKASDVLDEQQMIERGEILADLIRIDDEIRQLRDPWVKKMDDVLSPRRSSRMTNPLSSISIDLD
ncbi:MAG: hypothetical protein WA888_21770 [Burkholderiaceae bacterium]